VRAWLQLTAMHADRYFQNSSRVSGVKIRRCLLLALRHHFCGIRLSRYSPRSELFSLNVILGLPWPSVVDLPANLHAFIVDLPAGFPFRRHLFDPFVNQSSIDAIVPESTAMLSIKLGYGGPTKRYGDRRASGNAFARRGGRADLGTHAVPRCVGHGFNLVSIEVANEASVIIRVIIFSELSIACQ
jgi:hypothetical protein